MNAYTLRDNHWRTAAVLALSVSWVAGIQAKDAQTDEQLVLDEIVVVASKIPRPINSIAANVTVVSKQDLQESLATSVSDVFQYTPGIDALTSGTRFGTESINIRGIGGNRVAMLIDGVPIGDQFDIGTASNATRDFANAGLIQRAEILHGPASTLYGSDAIGGVVAMYTPDPQDIHKGNASGGEILTTYRDANDS
ncbi:MAG: TonB-dependent receptor plug domain-containing protein [Arenicella sp.]|nr:TonB-dependent receptor plug domain-containing protein [Arenicella sp.]